MKISNSKKQLAKIISENGGWRELAEWSIQDSDKNIEFMTRRPEYMKSAGAWYAYASRIGSFKIDNLLPNWHQTILSRDEYFHLYPAPDAKPEYCESVMRSIPEPEIHSKNTALTQVDDINVVESKPTIEQLAANYRNAKDYAERKQEEADAAKADAEDKLAELVAAGKALGLLVSPITEKQEPELVAAKFTGKFHSAKHGDRPSDLDMICDGCGKRFGHHVGFECRP